MLPLSIALIVLGVVLFAFLGWFGFVASLVGLVLLGVYAFGAARRTTQ